MLWINRYGLPAKSIELEIPSVVGPRSWPPIVMIESLPIPMMSLAETGLPLDLEASL